MVPDGTPAPRDSSKKGKDKRGFFGKLKDKAIGTKEEREAMKKERDRVRTFNVRRLYLFPHPSHLYLDRERERTAICRDDSRTASTLCTTASPL
jgi:hypothetical protein